jgi:hypothetical protein
MLGSAKTKNNFGRESVLPQRALSNKNNIAPFSLSNLRTLRIFLFLNILILELLTVDTRRYILISI